MDRGSDSYRRFLGGDDTGFLEIVREYRDGLILYIYGIVSDFHTAEELAEETFIRLVMRKPVDKGSGSFKTWLYTMGRNRAIDYLRRNKKRREISLTDLSDSVADLENLEECYLKEVRRKAVHGALKKLKHDYQQVLWLIYFENFTCKQAATVMKKSVHAVEVMASRARKALAEELRKEGYVNEIL